MTASLSQAAPAVATMMLIHGGRPITRFEIIVLFAVAGTVILGGFCWGMGQAWIERFRSRKWQEVPAVIDIVSVAFIPDDDHLIPAMQASSVNPFYRATLTYIYNFPDQQLGDYSRDFGKKEDAEAWANSYKGETVKVHVDPRDPTRSLLQDEDL